MTELIELHEATCRNSTYKQGLIDLINDLDNKITNMVEVGSYQGVGTGVIAESQGGYISVGAVCHCSTCPSRNGKRPAVCEHIVGSVIGSPRKMSRSICPNRSPT